MLEVKELLGPASLTMTLRYSHFAPERLREAVGALDGGFRLADPKSEADVTLVAADV